MVVIDAYRGGGDIGYTGNGIIEKDFNLMISKYINDRLNSLGINTYLTRDTDTDLNISQRASLIKEAFGNNSNIIAISNRLNQGEEEGVEILYSLKNSNSLANMLENSFKERNIKVNKVYQKRDENDTSKDYDELQKNTGNIQTIIVNYGYVNNQNDAINLKNDYKKYAESVIKTISTQLGVPYSYVFDDEYIVKKGDSLWKISQLFGISIDELKKYNNLNSNTLNIGQIIKIPSPDSESKNQNTYTVAKGDSLWSISRKYNISVSELKSINNLNSNLLSIGQILKIPVNNKTYVVKKGDSLWLIARNFNTTVDKIKTLNNLSSNLINIGQVLILP
ncbi:MAG: LysM peptidoglycan-binding domain-containing protein [Bacilli bacterium]|nr:LysM peptidoglycan-binding domain-containing protein [Bacilli bacterium]